jgi:hypothetical protein
MIVFDVLDSQFRMNFYRKLLLLRSYQRITMTEGRTQFRNPEIGERLQFEAVTIGLGMTQGTEMANE